MKKTYSIDFYLISFSIIAVILKIIGLISFSWTEIFSYVSMFWGMSMFYYSYLKNYKFGVFAGSVLFQIGVVLLSLSIFEIYNPAEIFIPTLLVIAGSSLILSNLLVKSNKIILLLSTFFLLAGIVLMLLRGHYTLNLFLNSVYLMLKEFWLIIIVLLIVIIIVINEFKKENKN